MDRAFLKVIKFNNSDVIATSLIVASSTDASSVPVIWLDVQSVINYNAISATDINLDDYEILEDYVYVAYSGKYDKRNRVFQVVDNDPPTMPDEKLINHVGVGDRKMYNLIYTWLQTNYK